MVAALCLGTSKREFGYSGDCHVAGFAVGFGGFGHYVRGCVCGAPADWLQLNAVFSDNGCGIVPGGGGPVDGRESVFVVSACG